jgi:hypothetical protein
MPDWWELAHGLDPFDPSDADLDPDGDTLTNLEEFRLGTDPMVSNVVHTMLYVGTVPPQPSGKPQAIGDSRTVYMAVSNLQHRALQTERDKVGHREYRRDGMSNTPPKIYLAIENEVKMKWFEDFQNWEWQTTLDYQMEYSRFCRKQLDINGHEVEHQCQGNYRFYKFYPAPDKSCPLMKYDATASYTTPTTNDVVAEYIREDWDDDCKYEIKGGIYQVWDGSCCNGGADGALYYYETYYEDRGYDVTKTLTLFEAERDIPRYLSDVDPPVYETLYDLQRQELMDEYTDAMHDEATRSDLTTFPGGLGAIPWGEMRYGSYNFSAGQVNWSTKSDPCEAGAYKTFSVPRVEGHNRHILRDYEIRWVVPTEAGEVYRLVWWERFTPEDTNQPPITTEKSDVIIGTGGLVQSRAIHIAAPDTPGTIKVVTMETATEVICSMPFTACDGEEVPITISVFPKHIAPSQIQVLRSGLAGNSNYGNPAGELSEAEIGSDQYHWKIPNARWYATQSNHCNDAASYTFGCRVSFPGRPITDIYQTLTVDAVSCAVARVIPDTYFSGEIEVHTEQEGSQWKATVSQGTFVRDLKAKIDISVPTTSQFYAMNLAEEEYHKYMQYENPDHPILKNYWKAEDVMTELQAKAPFYGDTEEEAKENAKGEWNALRDRYVRTEGERLAYPNPDYCAIEREAKEAVGASYRYKMQCAYPACQ